MWIRNQEITELINADRIQVENYRIYTYPPNNSGWIELGNYDTKERAIAVLDEIQEHLVKNGNATSGIKVFDMPQK